jgi:DnaJ-class molecular chaperone
MGRIEELSAFVEGVFPDLDLYNYYQLLEIEEQARVDEVRAAFYRQASRLHPDRFGGKLGNPTTKEKLGTIYARIAEAYKVLSEPKKRASYDAALKTGTLRYVEVEREKKGPQNPEDVCKKPEAKKFARLAMQNLRAGDIKGANQNFKFALAYEPENPFLKEQAATTEAELKKAAMGAK